MDKNIEEFFDSILNEKKSSDAEVKGRKAETQSVEKPVPQYAEASVVGKDNSSDEVKEIAEEKKLDLNAEETVSSKSEEIADPEKSHKAHPKPKKRKKKEE